MRRPRAAAAQARWKNEDPMSLIRASAEAGYQYTVRGGIARLSFGSDGPPDEDDTLWVWDDESLLPNSAVMCSARKATFDARWPHKGKRGWRPTSNKLAEAGFHFTPAEENEDSCMCRYCGIELNNWERNDNPVDEHQLRRPGCAFFNCILASALENAPQNHKKRDSAFEAEESVEVIPPRKKRTARSVSAQIEKQLERRDADETDASPVKSKPRPAKQESKLDKTRRMLTKNTLDPSDSEGGDTDGSVFEPEPETALEVAPVAKSQRGGQHESVRPEAESEKVPTPQKDFSEILSEDQRQLEKGLERDDKSVHEEPENKQEELIERENNRWADQKTEHELQQKNLLGAELGRSPDPCTESHVVEKAPLASHETARANASPAPALPEAQTDGETSAQKTDSANQGEPDLLAKSMLAAAASSSSSRSRGSQHDAAPAKAQPASPKHTHTSSSAQTNGPNDYFESESEAVVEDLVTPVPLPSFPRIQDYLPIPFPHKHTATPVPPVPDPSRVTVLEWIIQQQDYLLNTMRERVEQRLITVRQRNAEERRRLEKSLRSQ